MTEAPRPSRRGWVLEGVGLLLFIGAFAAFDAYMKSVPATASAKAFVAAIRAGQASEVRAYERVRGSASVEGSFLGDWTVGCMDGMVAPFGPIWLVMAKQQGAWFVADMRIDNRPDECDQHEVD